MTIKFLHVLCEARRGGCERLCLTLCRELTDFQHQVIVLGGEGALSAKLAEVAQVSHLNILKLNQLSFMRRWRSVCAELQADFALYWSTARWPLVAHGLSSACQNLILHLGTAKRPALQSRALYALESRYLSQPKRCRFVCASEHARQAYFDCSLAPKVESCVIDNCVGISFADKARGNGDWSSAEFKVGSVGRLCASKDQVTLIRAVAELYRSGVNLTLELVGDGPNRKELEDLAKALGVFRLVNFLGEQEDVRASLRRWDVFAYGAKALEGFSIAVAEALSQALPVVVSDTPAMRSTCGEAAVYFPQEDAAALAEILKRLAGDLDLRQQLSERSLREAKQRFSPARFARLYMEQFG